MTDTVEMLLSNSKDLVSIVAALTALLTFLFALIAALRSGLLRRLKIGSFELEVPERDLAQAKSLIQSISAPRTEESVPFETEHLARYYAQVLFQSKIAFWFSILAGVIGFSVIVAAVFRHTDGQLTLTLLQGGAGVVVDAIASIFFVQANKAQQSMNVFFEKLRSDRQQSESRKLCESINHPDAKDALKIELALYYAGLANHDAVAAKIITACFKRIGDEYGKP